MLGKKEKNPNEIPEQSCNSWLRPSFGHLQAPSLPEAGIGVAQVTELQLHSLSGNSIMRFNYRAAVSPAYLYHLKSLESNHPCLATGLF